MPTTDNKPFQDAIRRTLAHHSGSAPDARAIAEATLNTWYQMADRLTPIIGTKGVDVLFSRSLHLTCISFQWLAITEDHVNSSALLSGLKARLASRETEAATEASYTLLVTFTELLVTMIGEALTRRLLRPVWVPHPSDPYRRANHEHQSYNTSINNRSTGTR